MELQTFTNRRNKLNKHRLIEQTKLCGAKFLQARQGNKTLMHDNKNCTNMLRCFPFVKTDQPDHSRRDEKLTFNHNYSVRSVKF